MNYLFSKTIVSKFGKCTYKLFEFKLASGYYHAELVSPINPKSISTINFTKRDGKWQTPSRSREAERLAKIFGVAIDKSKKLD
jgi:hypothetical protein